MAKKRGPKEHKPNDTQRQTVEQMSAVGRPQEGIAAILGIDVKTLRKHYRVELDTAAEKANAKVSGALYNKAIAGDSTAIIWWEKTRQGRKETNVVEGNLDGVINITMNPVKNKK